MHDSVFISAEVCENKRRALVRVLHMSHAWHMNLHQVQDVTAGYCSTPRPYMQHASLLLNNCGKAAENFTDIPLLLQLEAIIKAPGFSKNLRNSGRITEVWHGILQNFWDVQTRLFLIIHELDISVILANSSEPVFLNRLDISITLRICLQSSSLQRDFTSRTQALWEARFTESLAAR